MVHARVECLNLLKKRKIIQRKLFNPNRYLFFDFSFIKYRSFLKILKMEEEDYEEFDSIPELLIDFEETIPKSLKLYLHVEDLIFECTPKSLKEASRLNKKYHYIGYKQLNDLFSILWCIKYRQQPSLNTFWASLYYNKPLPGDINQSLHFVITQKEIRKFEARRKKKEYFQVVIAEDTFDTFVSYSATNEMNAEFNIYQFTEHLNVLNYAASQGSFQIFQYILINYPSMIDSSLTPKASIAGGNESIIEVIEQHGLTFENTIKIARIYHQNHLLLWLRENFRGNDVFDPYQDYVWYNTADFIFNINIMNKRNLEAFKRSMILEEQILYTIKNFSEDKKQSIVFYVQYKELIKLISIFPMEEASDCEKGLFYSTALRNGSLKYVKYLEQFGSSSCSRENLYNAVLSGNIEVVEHVLKSEKDRINSTNFRGETPLFAAIFGNNKDICELLLNNGADANHKNENGDTPIIVSVAYHSIDVIDCLVKHGASINDSDSRLWTPLHHCAHSGYLEGVNYFVEKGADINCKTKIGNTPLHLASMNNNKEIVNYLLEKGADANIVNDEGKTAYDLVHLYHIDEIENILLVYMNSLTEEVNDNCTCVVF